MLSPKFRLMKLRAEFDQQRWARQSLAGSASGREKESRALRQRASQLSVIFSEFALLSEADWHCDTRITIREGLEKGTSEDPDIQHKIFITTHWFHI